MRLKQIRPGYVAFWCPGCECPHVLNVVAPPGGRAWGFNGNYESPTITPSFLARTGHYVSNQPQPPNCDICNDPYPGSDYKCSICHVFVTDGVIDFLNDCTHALAGKKVPLINVREWPDSWATD